MAPHSSTLAWKIPRMEEPGKLQSMGLLGVGHDWATSLSLFTFMHWSRKWQPTPAFLPEESQGWGSLVGCRLWGHTESDTTEGAAAAPKIQSLKMIATEFYWEYHLCEGSYCPGREAHGSKSWILEELTYPSHAEFVVVLLVKNTHTQTHFSKDITP